MSDLKSQSTIQQHPLIDFADRWELDGDYIRCRNCNRPQQTSYALWDFPHASGCQNANAERNPWKTLASLITAQIARAKQDETGPRYKVQNTGHLSFIFDTTTGKPFSHGYDIECDAEIECERLNTEGAESHG